MNVKVLMLGWEYPPHIAGGLGIACEGLTKGLSAAGIEVTFIVPKLFGDESAPHMSIRSAASSAHGAKTYSAAVRVIEVPAALLPYTTEATHRAAIANALSDAAPIHAAPASIRGGAHYGANLFAEVSRYAEEVLAHARELDFDVIHAHDWMTYPAGIAVAQASGKPLVVHVHSLEYDRSGEHVHPAIDAVERQGIARADAVLAVSGYTRSVILREHRVSPHKVHVVHNGIYSSRTRQYYRNQCRWPDNVVLFLGRVTFQKGPDYFVRAAERVVKYVADAKFVLAGSGDMLGNVIEMTHALGLERHFYFPGFLRGPEVERMFSLARLYVMPSVSEPFGLSALEAVNFDVPILISRQSGVAEVVNGALTFDFWDVDRMAEMMIHGLLYEELRADLCATAKADLGKLQWDASARRTMKVYNCVI